VVVSLWWVAYVGLNDGGLATGGSSYSLGGGLKKTEIGKKTGTLDEELEQ